MEEVKGIFEKIKTEKKVRNIAIAIVAVIIAAVAYMLFFTGKTIVAVQSEDGVTAKVTAKFDKNDEMTYFEMSSVAEADEDEIAEMELYIGFMEEYFAEYEAQGIYVSMGVVSKGIEFVVKAEINDDTRDVLESEFSFPIVTLDEFVTEVEEMGFEVK